MLSDKSYRKTTFRYKQVSPEIAQVKTNAILRILADVLKRQQIKENEEGGKCLIKV
jgi:hypothetical protein